MYFSIEILIFNAISSTLFVFDQYSTTPSLSKLKIGVYRQRVKGIQICVLNVLVLL